MDDYAIGRSLKRKIGKEPNLWTRTTETGRIGREKINKEKVKRLWRRD
jgi:hypothetical protein